jgi:DegV family protein with EDD domain
MTFKTIKLVTDSVADVPDDLVDELGITVVPCYVNYGGQSFADDGVELIREAYYNALPNMSETPTTAAMSPDFAREMIEPAFAGADHLVVITTPSRLSGIHNAMRQATSNLPPEQVTVIDSGQLSIGIGWQVILGAEVAAETGDVERTLAAIRGVQQNQSVYATLGSLEFLRRSGRVGWATAGIGNLLHIKPTVRVLGGDVSAIARTRTFSRALDYLADVIRESGPLDRAAILHINNTGGMDELRIRLADILPENTITGLIGPALGTHIGPGSVGIATVNKGWKDAIST